MWKKQYIDKDKDTISNGWSELGSLAHNILESFYKREIKGKEMEKKWQDGHMELDLRFPSPYMIGPYINGISLYFLKMGGKFPEYYNGSYKIIGVEREINIELAEGVNMIGYIDLELMDKEKNAVIVDHKISKVFEGSKLEEKLRQLYLYSLSHNRPPKSLMYNFFWKGEVLEVPFTEEGQQEALKWALSTIKAIEKEKKYKAAPDKFFCKNLCSFGHTCEFAKK